MNLKDMRNEHVTFVPVMQRSRLLLFHAMSFCMRIDELRRALAGGDLDRASVAITLWLRAVEVGLRTPSAKKGVTDIANRLDFSTPSELAASDASSIARSTGIPRETVRRKLKELEELGLVVRHGAQYAVGAPKQLTAIHKAMHQVLHDAVLFLNASLADGPVRIKEHA